MLTVLYDDEVRNESEANAKGCFATSRYDAFVDTGSSTFLVHSKNIFKYSAYIDRQKIMSWKTINAILARAATDETFCQKLLLAPIPTILAQKFELNELEREKLEHIVATDLSEFSQQVLNVFWREDDQV